MLQQIKAGKEVRPFIFNYSALKGFCQDTGKKLSDMNLSELDFSEVESMMFRGFEAGAKASNTKFSYKLADMEAWLNLDFGLIEKVSKAVESSFAEPKKSPPKRIPLPPLKKK